MEESTRNTNEENNNFWDDFLKKLKEKASQGIQDLRGKLSNMSLEDLSQLTQMIGNQVNAAVISIQMIVEEIVKRARKSNETIEVDIETPPPGREHKSKRPIIVKPSISEKEVQDLELKIDAAIKQKKRVRYRKYRKVSPHKHFRDEVDKIQKDLDKLKRS